MLFLPLLALSLLAPFAAAEGSIQVDENNRVTENLLLIRASAPPAFLQLEAIGRRKLLIAEPEAERYFESKEVMASCIWRGFALDYFNASINTVTVGEDLDAFVRDKCNHLEMGFISNFEGETLTITHVDENDVPVPTSPKQKLKYGERNTAWVHTVPTHRFLVKGKTFRQVYVAQVPGMFVVGENPDYTKLGATISEANKVSRVRQELARVQHIKRVFTDVGFKKMPIPRKVWGEVSTYWYNNKAQRIVEAWLNTGFFVNWNEVNQDLVVPPFVLKARWQELLKPVLEEWTQTALEATDIYGIRTYYRNAWLSNHVDRENTHAASSILNLEQVDMEEDWEVHIWDIHGERHRVVMEPGTMLLYESARCMHGRPVPLRGKSYTNMFFHYRPIGLSKWYKDETVGKLGPDIMSKFDPAQAATHEIGWVGEAYRDYFHGSGRRPDL